MSWNVSAWSIRNPTPAILLFILLTVAGVLSFRAMKVQNFPDIDLPTVVVSALLPGAAPEQLETGVARKIENAIATVQGVKHIYARLQDGAATITVEFHLEKPVQEAVDDVRAAVARVRSDLPGDMLEPVITRMDVAGLPILTFTIASDHRDEVALSWFVDDAVSRAVLSVPGVGAVARVGGVTREIAVELDPVRMLALGATAADISPRLRSIQLDAPGGRTDLGGAEQSVRTLATAVSAQELARLSITLPDGRAVRLADVASVRDTVAERRSIALLDGKPVVGFEITRSRGAGEVEVARDVRARLAGLQERYPDLRIGEAVDFVVPVEENYDGSLRLLYEGAALAVIVVWFFLRNARATFVAATALPLSIIPAFAGMYLAGFSINVVTLLSLSLVVGILVDDAIVEIENIMRHLRDGKTPYRAAMEAADEIGLAVIATTFTLISVFLPTAFMTGVAGRFFVQFGWTASLAVFASLVVARMLTPMMAAYLLRPDAPREDGRLMRAYLRAARWCLAHRTFTGAAAAAFLAGSLALVPLLPTGFMPPDDLSQTQVHVELPPGSTFERTLRVAEQVRAIVQRHPDVVQVYSAVGGGTAGADPFVPQGIAEARKATLTLDLVARERRRGHSRQAIEGELRRALEAVPGARIEVGLNAMGEKYVLVLAGEDGEVLARHARIVGAQLRTLPGIGNVVSTASLTRPEWIVRPDDGRAADLGVTTAAIADTLRIATVGDYDQYLAKLDLARRQVPIVVRVDPRARTDAALLEQLQVPGARGPVALASVADIAIGSGPVQIDRYDRLRNINFRIELNGQPLGEIEKLALALPALRDLPPGVLLRTVGDAEAMSELGESFALAMFTGVLCIYAVLVLLFRDFVQPVTILAALVLSVPGAFLALYLARLSISMPSMIGMIMLMGIATKNSILLVEYAIMARRDRGLSRVDALLDACHKRARPIMMTTVAMGAGMTPIAIGWGVDPAFRAPMALVVIGGLVTSTFLSLLVVPVVFTWVDDLVQGLHRLHRSLQ